MTKVYRSRLSGEKNETTSSFLSSIKDDKRIIEDDIDGTEAHNIMLYENKIISKNDLSKILTSLEKIRLEWKQGKLDVNTSFEDIHEFIEDSVIKDVGMSSGGKLHTARSRNDQVVTDLRMRIREEVNEISSRILKLVETILQIAEKNKDVKMLLYTHTQHAQVGTLGHSMIAYSDMFVRDFQRIDDAYIRLNLNPLGSAAIAGTSFEIDRDRTASLLGFDGLIENSVDAVSSRDFALEIASSLAILMSNMSRIAEDIIVWSSSEFRYVEVKDEYASPSSIMPQKKNPCTVELVRGSSGNVYGALVNLLTLVKGLLTGYNRDLQNMKEPIWTGLDSVKDALDVFTGVISTLIINNKRMSEVIGESYASAVDLAEIMTTKHELSFREAHTVVGETVKELYANGLKMNSITPEILQKAAMKTLDKKIRISEKSISEAVDPTLSLGKRISKGSPSPDEVQRMLKDRSLKIKLYRKKLTERIRNVQHAKNNLKEIVKSFTLR